jgi:hypothetical protein
MNVKKAHKTVSLCVPLWLPLLDSNYNSMFVSVISVFFITNNSA